MPTRILGMSNLESYVKTNMPSIRLGMFGIIEIFFDYLKTIDKSVLKNISISFYKTPITIITTSEEK